MCVNGLEQTEHDPDVDSEDVEVLGKVAVEDGSSNCTGGKDEHLRKGGCTWQQGQSMPNTCGGACECVCTMVPNEGLGELIQRGHRRRPRENSVIVPK